MLKGMQSPGDPPAGQGRKSRPAESPLLRYLPFIFLAAFIPVILVLLVATAVVVGSILRDATRTYWKAKKDLSAGGGLLSREMGNAEKLISADVVIPSFAEADGHATAGRIMKEVLQAWPRARLASAAYQMVRPDGTLHMDRPEGGIMILTFYDTSKIEQAAGLSSIPDAMITVVLQNNMILTNKSPLQAERLEDFRPLKTMPACDLRTLREKASLAGHPGIGNANVYFPMMAPWLDEKSIRQKVKESLGSASDRDLAEAMDKVRNKGWSEKRFLSYFFEIPLYAGSDLASFYLLKDCTPISFEDAKKLYAAFGLR
jgi:hypothetical protein